MRDDAPIAGGGELWGFPKKRASPKIVVASDVHRRFLKLQGAYEEPANVFEGFSPNSRL